MVKLTFFVAAASSLALAAAQAPCPPQVDPFAVYDPTPCVDPPRPTSTPAPTTSTPTPSTSTPVPSTSTPTPSTSTPVPSTSTPTPSTSTPVPSTSTPTPSTSTPAPTTTPVPTTPAPGAPIAFCGYNRQALSEYYGDIYSDVLRNNNNEKFVYNAAAQSIVAQSNGQCLDAYVDGNNKFQVHTYACSSTNGNQKWTFNTQTHRIEHAVHQGLCLAAGKAGDKARVEPCNQGVSQFFADCSVPTPVALRFQTCYTNSWLSEYMTGLYADAQRNNVNEQFAYDPVAQTIRVASNGQCLDAFKDGGKFGLHTYACDDKNVNQKWRLEGDRVKHATHANLCLDADPTDSSHKAQVWECFPYNKNQCWNIVRN